MNTSHISKRSSALLAAVLAVGAFGSIYNASAQAIISNGTVGLGVNDTGNLNIPGPSSAVPSPSSPNNYGLRHVPTNLEATADGCPCEGWGASAGGTSLFFNQSSGNGGLGTVTFSSTATTALSKVTEAGGALEVTHDYHPSVNTPFLYEVAVSIKNTSGTAQNILYRRVMDWDIEPNTYSEFVTIAGYTGASALKHVSRNGFASSDPLSAESYLDSNFTDSGPNDHGALFDFDFGLLNPGETITFNTYYGAAPSEAAALTALGDEGVEAYSLGQANANGDPVTFMFAFDGIGQIDVELPTTVPEPSTVVGGIALAGLAASKMLRRKKA